MNRKPLSHSILLMLVGVVLLTLTVVLTQQRHENALLLRAEAQRAAEALSSVEAIRARTSEAERDRFGYGVTNDKTLLAQAQILLSEAVAERDRLSPRLRATAIQRQHLELLSGLLKDAQDLRLPGEAPTVHPVATPVPTSLPTQQGVKKAAPLVQAVPTVSPVLTLPKVRELGDLTREVLRDLTQGEMDACSLALANARWSDRISEWVLLGGTAGALVCLLVGFVGLRKELLRLQRELATQGISLQESQDMLHQVDDGLVLLDPSNGAVVAANERFAANSGYPRGQLTEGLVRPFLPADPSAPTGDILRLLARTIREGACAEQIRLHPRTGPDRIVRASFRRLTLSSQARVLVVFSDIETLETARRKAEKECDYLRQFLLPASSPALLLDPEGGRILDATPEAGLLFGTDVESLTSGSLNPFTLGEGLLSRENLLSHFEKALSLEPQRFEWSSLTAQKQLVSFSVSLQRLSIHGHDRLLALLKDQSLEKHLRAELKDLKVKYDTSSQNEKSLRQDVAARTEREIKLKEESSRLTEERNRLHSEKDSLSRPLSSVSGVVFSLGLDGTYRLLEGRDLLKLGLAPGELTGRKAVDSPRGPLRSLHLIQRALAGENFTAIEEAGGLLWEIHLSPLRDSSGHPDGCVGTALDVTEREKAREALQYRLDALVALLETLPDAYFLADHEGQVAFACGTGFSALGLSPWDAQSKTLEEILPNPEIWKQGRQKALEEGTATLSWESSGETFKGFVTRLKPAGSDATLLGGVLRPTGPVAVPEVPSPWKGVSEVAPVGLLVLQADGIIKSLNPVAAQLLHQSSESSAGIPWVNLASEPHHVVWNDALDKWRSGQFDVIRLPFTSEDGEIELEVAAAPFIGSDTTNHWVVVLQRAPEKVKEVKPEILPAPPSIWEGVSEAAPIGLAVLETNGTIKSLNPVASQLLHQNGETPQGTLFASLTGEPNRTIWNTTLEKWAQGQFNTVLLPFTSGDAEMELEVSAAPFVGSDKTELWVVALQRVPAKASENISLDSFMKLERSQREILQATGPSVSRLLEDVADIRRNTVGLREKAGWAINPDGLHHIHQLEEAAQDAAQRLEGWFDYQMAMTRDLHYAAVDLSMIAKETSDICKSEFDRVGAVLTIRDLPMIEADPDLLHMMFRNLYDFTLAQKLVGQPPQILVRATIVRAPEKSASPGWCQLSIEFDGPATTEAELEHLFQAGTKPDETVPGGGLGLLTVRRIAERHGGTVSAQPKEGSGVSLIVVLPLLAPKSW